MRMIAAKQAERCYVTRQLDVRLSHSTRTIAKWEEYFQEAEDCALTPSSVLQPTVDVARIETRFVADFDRNFSTWCLSQAVSRAFILPTLRFYVCFVLQATIYSTLYAAVKQDGLPKDPFQNVEKSAQSGRSGSSNGRHRSRRSRSKLSPFSEAGR